MRIQRVGLVVCLVLGGACSSKLGAADVGASGASGRGTSGGGAGGTSAGGEGGTGNIDGGPIVFDGGPSIRIVDAGTATTLATGAPADIAVDATHVYWTDTKAKTVMKVPKAGGAAITVASSQDVGPGLAVDATHVYWTTTQGSVMKATLDGGTPITIASEQRRPNSLAVAADNLYWANAGAAFMATGSVMKASLATGEVVTLAGNRDVGQLVVDATSLYWTSNGEGPGFIDRLPLEGGTVESVGIVVQGSWPVVESIAVGAGNIAWSVFIQQPSGVHRVMTRALAGGTETTLLASSHAFALVAEGLVLYAPEGRTILRIAVDGGAVAAIPTEGTPTHLATAVNDPHIYFTTAEGAVMAIGKP